MRTIDADALVSRCGDYYVEEGPEYGFIGTLKCLVDMQPTIGGWISVKDRLPDRSGNYLVYTSIEGRSIIKTSYWMASTQTWLGVEACSVLIHITHWMPLPEPPWREEKHET